MRRWCFECKGSHHERDGGIVYDESNAPNRTRWVCQNCTRQFKVLGDRRVRSLESIRDERGSEAVDAALDDLSRSKKACADN